MENFASFDSVIQFSYELYYDMSILYKHSCFYYYLYSYSSLYNFDMNRLLLPGTTAAHSVLATFSIDVFQKQYSFRNDSTSNTFIAHYPVYHRQLKLQDNLISLGNICKSADTLMLSFIRDSALIVQHFHNVFIICGIEQVKVISTLF